MLLIGIDVDDRVVADRLNAAIHCHVVSVKVVAAMPRGRSSHLTVKASIVLYFVSILLPSYKQNARIKCVPRVLYPQRDQLR